MRFATLLFAVALVVSSAFAVVPTTMTYQAIFTDLEGNVMPDGVYTIGFHIFPSPVGGPPVWSEWQEVTVTNGVFEVILGTIFPLNFTDFLDPEGDGQWMSLEYEDTWMHPRQFINSVPYAFIACLSDSTRKLGDFNGDSLSSVINLYDSRLDSHALCLDSAKSDIDSLYELLAELQNQIDLLQQGGGFLPEVFDQNDFDNIDIPLDGVQISVESLDINVDTDGGTIAFNTHCGNTVSPNFPELCCGEVAMFLDLIDVSNGQSVHTCATNVAALPGSPNGFCFVSGLDSGTYRIRATLATSLPSGGDVSFVRLLGISYSGLVF